jgi:hypothetical protein
VDYHIERAVKKLRTMVGNKARVEDCITEEFKVKEIAYFSSVNTPIMQYNVDEDILCSELQNFQWKGMAGGASTAYHPTQEEQTPALLYM